MPAATVEKAVILARFVGAVLIAHCSLTSIAEAAEFPIAAVPYNAGINTGAATLRLDDDDFVKIREAGFAYVRIDIFWDQVETQKGKYNWAGYDTVVEKLRRNDLKAIFVLDYNNHLYDREAGGIRTEPARRGFSDFSAAAVRRFNKSLPGVIWEIWNEPNSNEFWKPERNADEFMAMLKQAVSAIREADPAATVISGGVLALSWHVTRDYLDRCFQLGLLNLVDGLGVHLYGGRRNIYPERIVDELKELRQTMSRYGAAADFPILNTEFGAQLEEYGKIQFVMRPERSETEQAETYVRMYLLGLAQGLRMNIWYEWRWKDGFSGHAILNSDGTARKAYVAIANLITQLRDYRFVRRVDVFRANDFVFEFERDGRRKLAAWTVGAPRTVLLPFPNESASRVSAVDMLGEGRTIGPDDGGIRVRLTNSPIYIDLGAR